MQRKIQEAKEKKLTQLDLSWSKLTTVILKPAWGTAAVYMVLFNEIVRSNLGRFNDEDLADIWYQEEYANMQGELLQLMMKFKLCYLIPNTKDSYIAPQLLTEIQPKYEWKENNNLILRYTYDFMPKGIITQFIVIMHRLIYEQELVWRSEVILDQDETKAEIIESYNKREIKIRVEGKAKKELLTIITYQLDQIHNSYHRLRCSKLIPCNCQVCKNTQNPYFYPYDKLKERIAYGKNTIECGNPPYDDVNVRSLIDDVESFIYQEQLQKRDIIETSRVEGNFMTRDQNTYTGGDHQKNITVGGNANINVEYHYYNTPEQKQTLAEVAKEIEDLLTYFQRNNPPISEAIQTVNTATERQPKLKDAVTIEAAIKANPTLKERLNAAGKAAYIETVKALLPPVGVAIEAVKAWNNP